MDPKLLLVKIVTLLFKESQLNDSTTQSSALVKPIVASIKFPETGMDFDRTRESMQALRATALWMCENPPDHSYDRAALLQRIRVNVGDDDGLYYAFEQGIEAVEDSDTLKRQCLELRHELRSYTDQAKVKDILKKASQKVLFNPEEIDWRSFVRDVHAELEPYTHSGHLEKLEGMVEEVDVANSEGMEALMSRGQAETATDGILRLGWQALNRMLGDHNGFRRGESVVVGALQHNFKTGYTMNIFKQLALYNKPWMRDPTKKPCLVHISLENELPTNILWLYSNLMENETGVECDLSGISVRDASRYVYEKLSANGYHIKMARFDPSDMSYHTFFDYITRLEAEGYEVHAVVLDYLNMMSKKGCLDGPAGFATRDLFRRCRNFCAPRGITFITPAQLSTEAKGLVRQGVEDFVKEIANKGYYDSCRTIDQEVDLEIYIHIVKVNGESYLTVQRGKHRKVKITPEKDLYHVLPFSPVGGVRDDINGKDTSRKHPGGGAMGSEDERPWWETSKQAET